MRMHHLRSNKASDTNLGSLNSSPAPVTTGLDLPDTPALHPGDLSPKNTSPAITRSRRNRVPSRRRSTRQQIPRVITCGNTSSATLPSIFLLNSPLEFFLRQHQNDFPSPFLLIIFKRHFSLDFFATGFGHAAWRAAHFFLILAWPSSLRRCGWWRTNNILVHAKQEKGSAALWMDGTDGGSLDGLMDEMAQRPKQGNFRWMS